MEALQLSFLEIWKSEDFKFWKYVSVFRKNNSTSIQLHAGGSCVEAPGEVAEVCSHVSPPLGSVSILCSDSLPLIFISDLTFRKPLKGQDQQSM